MIRPCTSLAALAALLGTASAGAGPLLTGVVEDVNAQTIEMPSLPGSWQRRIEWMAQEGSEVTVGDIVVRLEPGDLTAQEEQARANLERARLSAERWVDEERLQVLEAEKAVAQAESTVRIAELDASIPRGTIPQLDFDRFQLALETARQALIRAQAQLLNASERLADVQAETNLEVQQAEARHARMLAALEATGIRAEKPGFIIYSENPWNGKKIFPGETLFTGIEIASIASREDLQIRFWVHEADILDVRPGMKMTIVADAQDSEPFTAEVTWVSNQAVKKDDWSDSGYFSALAEPVGGVPASIWPGMSVMGRVSVADADL